MITATSTLGDYSVPGQDLFLKGVPRTVTPEQAAYLATRPEFALTFSREDGHFKDAEGNVRYLGYFGPVDSRFGYGGGGISILRAMTRLGIKAVVSPHYNNGFGTVFPRDLHPEAAAHLENRNIFPKWSMAHCLPDDMVRMRSPRKLAFTMWETSRIPDGSRTEAPFGDWAAKLNAEAETLFVPCQHNAEVFAECGVRIPIINVGYPLDVDIWPYVERPERETFTVVLFGDLTARKGPYEAVAGFQRAFPTETNVRLILKTQWGNLGYGGPPRISDPRVTAINEQWSRAQLLQFLTDADCLVWPSRGEGYGLPPMQALLTGLPVATTVHTGMAEWFDARYAEKIETAGLSTAPLYGEWLDPDIDSIADRLRWIYDNRKAALAKAKKGSAYLRKNFNLDKFAQRFGAAISDLED